MSYQAITNLVVHTIERVRRSPLRRCCPNETSLVMRRTRGSEIHVIIRGAHNQFRAITGQRMT
jgi:hypothetical protein